MKKNYLDVLCSVAIKTLHRSNGTHTINAKRIVFPSGVELVQAAVYPNTSTKKERLEMLKDLIAYGFKQKEAAEVLDISQPYASRLLNNK